MFVPPLTSLSPQTAASQSQSIPAISQAPQSGTMGYMGSQSVSMGYQPYSMQVSIPCLGVGGQSMAGLQPMEPSWGWPPTTALWVLHGPQPL